MNQPSWQTTNNCRPHPSRRYERLVGMLLNNDLIDVRKCEQYAMHRYVERYTGRFVGRCHAMALAAEHFSCSYEKVRNAVYRIDNQTKSFCNMNQVIKIKNEVDTTVIDIEGVIGLSEQWQFENPDSRIATYERFRECVARIADIRNTHIIVNIRSTGGDVNDAILIYEALRATGAHITTRCYGYTASAATIVAQAASEGSRLIAPTSLYLIHNSLCSTEGNAEELEQQVDMLRQTDQRIAEIYATRSGRDVEHIAALMAENGGRGRWLSPAEAIAEGLADALTEEPATTVEESGFGVKAKQGVAALLRAIGIDRAEDEHPEAADDINFMPREQLPLPNATVEGSLLAFEEAQRGVNATQVKSVEDPSAIDGGADPRNTAYELDARSMRRR